MDGSVGGCAPRGLTFGDGVTATAVHLLAGIPAGTAVMMLCRELLIQSGPVELSEILLIPVLALPFALFAITFLWFFVHPLALVGGMAALAIRRGFGVYR